MYILLSSKNGSDWKYFSREKIMNENKTMTRGTTVITGTGGAESFETGRAVGKTRDEKLDFIRGIGIVIVILGHAIQVYATPENNYFLTRVIMSFQMPLLFAISGYTAGFSFPAKNPVDYLRKKAKRLFVPYIAWALIHWFLFCMVTDRLNIFLNPEKIIEQLFFSDVWFLRQLFYIYLLLFISNCVNNITNNKKIFVGSLLLFIGVLFLFRCITIIPRFLYIEYYLWFLLGYGFYYIRKKINFFRASISVTLICAVGLILFSIFFTYVSVSRYFVCCIMICTLTLTIIFMPSQYVVGWMQFIGRSSLPLYVIHLFVLKGPLEEINFYGNLQVKDLLWISAVFTALFWLICAIFLTLIIRKNKTLKMILFGEFT